MVGWPFVYSAANHLLPDSECLCVGIAGSAITGADTRRHAAFLVQDSFGQWDIVHQTLNAGIVREAYADQFAWVRLSSLDEYSKVVVAEWMLEVWPRGANLAHPYGFDIPTSNDWNQDGSYRGSGAGSGLTCATLVASVLSRLGLPLVDANSWPMRPVDGHWQGEIAGLIQARFDPIQGDALLALARLVVRFRPEEVVGAAAMFAGAPVSFTEAEHYGNLVLCQMEEEKLL